jgi:hypothetical protein
VLLRNRQEARAVLGDLLPRLRALPHDELVRRFVGQPPEIDELRADSGAVYQVEVRGFWDDRRQRTVRVLVSVFDDTVRSMFSPLSEDFIKAPDGSFVGG